LIQFFAAGLSASESLHYFQADRFMSNVPCDARRQSESGPLKLWPFPLQSSDQDSEVEMNLSDPLCYIEIPWKETLTGWRPGLPNSAEK
jgi:hypothetical protein